MCVCVCPLSIWSTICTLLCQTKSDTKTHSHPLRLVLLFVCDFRCTPLSHTHRLVVPRTLSAVWHTHACAICVTRGLITWHTYMTSSACNQIHMSPSLLPRSVYLHLSLSLARVLSLFSSTSHSLSSFFVSLFPFLSLLSTLSPFFLCLVFLISARASAWRLCSLSGTWFWLPGWSLSCGGSLAF